jgi:hypothetical protein
MIQHICFHSGLLGLGQEVGSAQALPFGQLADLVLQVHARPRRLLRQELPRLRATQNKGQRDPAGGRGPLRNCPGIKKPIRLHNVLINPYYKTRTMQKLFRYKKTHKTP